MSDRKYKQRGYQDDEPSPSRSKRSGSKPKSGEARGQPPLRPKTPNMPGFHDVIRCAKCGGLLDQPICDGDLFSVWVSTAHL